MATTRCATCCANTQQRHPCGARFTTANAISTPTLLTSNTLPFATDTYTSKHLSPHDNPAELSRQENSCATQVVWPSTALPAMVHFLGRNVSSRRSRTQPGSTCNSCDAHKGTTVIHGVWESLEVACVRSVCCPTAIDICMQEQGLGGP